MRKIKGIYRNNKVDIVIDITDCINYFSNINGLSVNQVIDYFSDKDRHFLNYNSRRFL